MSEDGLVEEILECVKEDFLTLCEQYANLGKLLHAHAQDAVPLLQVLEQFQEIGDMLKLLGRGVDALGGVAVLEPPARPGRKTSAN